MIFRHIVCGVDGSSEALAAAAQAARLAEAETEIVLVASAEPETETSLQDALAAARATMPGGRDVRSLERETIAYEALIEVARTHDSDLIAVGSHGIGRKAGILMGSVATHVVHDAPCSVLVARSADMDTWPRTIVAGVDGSEPSLRAHQLAAALADLLDVPLRALLSVYGKAGYELETARTRVPGLDEREAEAVDALNRASGAGDLVVVGSRGLRGVRALGSVSERIAHEADASVLVARGA